MCRGRGIAVGLLAMALAAAGGSDMAAYQLYGIDLRGRSVVLKWTSFPIAYYVTDQDAPGVSAVEFQAAVHRAFGVWQAVKTAGVYARFAGFTSALPLEDDGMSTLGFRSRPDLDRVLGATEYVIDRTTGEILEADIFFNTAFAWSVAESGATDRFDLESIAVHEIGHLFGLGHSAIGETELRASGGRRVIAAETAMFPIAYAPGTTLGRTLRADDVAGISELYPAGGHLAETGAIQGRVLKNGQPVYGAHVVAFSLTTGRLIGGFTSLVNGRFVISGLSPGPHLLRVEPIDDAELDSFFEDTSTIDLGFGVTYLRQFVIVPRNGASEAVEITVTPR